MTNLGVAFYKGAGGLEKNNKKAIRWFKRAGTADGMFKVAKLLLEARAEEEAMEWMAKAAVAGHEEATVVLLKFRRQKAEAHQGL
jgi:TPR repeat protein